jgi:hypothetical protein
MRQAETNDLAGRLGIKAKSSTGNEFAASEIICVGYGKAQKIRQLFSVLGRYFSVACKRANHTISSHFFFNILTFALKTVKKKAQKCQKSKKLFKSP